MENKPIDDFSKKERAPISIKLGDYVDLCIAKWGLPIVIKASGLMQGKGVVTCETREEAIETTYKFLIEKNESK